MIKAVILRLYLLRSVVPRFLASMALFTAIMILVDLFGNLWRFLALGTSSAKILLFLALGIPSALVSAVPVALLFAVTYSLADLHASGELPIVFGSGISLASFTAPLMILAVFIAMGTFYFDDGIAVVATRTRNSFQREWIHQRPSFSTTDITVISSAGRFIYNAAFYDDARETLSGLVVVERDSTGTPVRILNAERAVWNGLDWDLRSVRLFRVLPDGGWTEESKTLYGDPDLNEPPETFRSRNRDIREMRRSELDRYAATLENAGLPSAEARAEFERRLSFAFAPIIVTLLSIATGGRFRKNVLLSSLLVSLVSATVYYVAQMVGMLMAKTEAIPPAAGAWSPLAAFIVLAIVLFRTARN